MARRWAYLNTVTRRSAVAVLIRGALDPLRTIATITKAETAKALAAYDCRVEILPVGPDFAMYFRRTTQAVQRCKNEQQRCSYGRDWVAAAGTTRSARTTFII